MHSLDQEVTVSRFRLVVVALATLAASLVLTAGATARTHDRNHDRIPDRWEKRHHLSLHHDQARRDQDHDGLRNRGEFKAGLDPRDADTDDDGLEDADEHAGTIASFDGTTLTIALAGGGSLTGKVTDATAIECEDAARDASHGDDDPSGDDHGDDEPGDDHGDDEPGDDHGDEEPGDDRVACGPGALDRGTDVEEAELRTRGGTAVFREIELRP